MKSWKCPNCSEVKASSDKIIICYCPCCLTEMVEYGTFTQRLGFEKEIWN